MEHDNVWCPHVPFTPDEDPQVGRHASGDGQPSDGRRNKKRHDEGGS